MRKILAIAALMILVSCSSSDEEISYTTVGFEQRTLAGNYTYGAYNIKDNYTESGFIFETDYDEKTGVFSGIGISSKFDANTFSSDNLFSTYAGGGCYDSRNFAIVHYYGEQHLVPTIKRVSGLKFAPSYAYFSITTNSYYTLVNGNERLGIAPFAPGDSLYVNVRGCGEEGEVLESLDFAVARYTQNDTTIMTKWQKVDLSSLGEVNSLQLRVLSTITDEQIGLSDIPPYVCMDDFTVRDL